MHDHDGREERCHVRPPGSTGARYIQGLGLALWLQGSHSGLRTRRQGTGLAGRVQDSLTGFRTHTQGTGLALRVQGSLAGFRARSQDLGLALALQDPAGGAWPVRLLLGPVQELAGMRNEAEAYQLRVRPPPPPLPAAPACLLPFGRGLRSPQS